MTERIIWKITSHPAPKQGLENQPESDKIIAMRRVSVLAMVWLLGACAAGTPAPLDQPDILRPPTPFAQPALTESSGVVLSRRYPGMLWTHNDSGNEPLLFATDTLGRDLGTIAVEGAENQDWEDIAFGPCRNTDCLYIGDTGDNREVRPSVTIYRVPEPDTAAAATRPADKLEARYPDGPHDAEAMYVDARGDLYLVTKGRSRGVLLFRVTQDAWSQGTAIAEPMGSLPLDPHGELFNMVTGADVNDRNDLVVLRTYRAIYLYRRLPDGILGASSPVKVCNVAGLESQGEGIAWLDDSRFVLTSEEGNLGPGTVMVLRCPPR